MWNETANWITRLYRKSKKPDRVMTRAPPSVSRPPKHRPHIGHLPESTWRDNNGALQVASPGSRKGRSPPGNSRHIRCNREWRDCAPHTPPRHLSHVRCAVKFPGTSQDVASRFKRPPMAKKWMATGEPQWRGIQQPHCFALTLLPAGRSYRLQEGIPPIGADVKTPTVWPE